MLILTDDRLHEQAETRRCGSCRDTDTRTHVCRPEQLAAYRERLAAAARYTATDLEF